jgi:hypothetical protein
MIIDIERMFLCKLSKKPKNFKKKRNGPDKNQECGIKEDKEG